MAKILAYRPVQVVSEDAWRSMVVKDSEADELITLYKGEVPGWFSTPQGTPFFVVQVFDLEEADARS